LTVFGRTQFKVNCFRRSEELLSRWVVKRLFTSNVQGKRAVYLEVSPVKRQLQKVCASVFALGQLSVLAVTQIQAAPVVAPSGAITATYIIHVTVIDAKTGTENRNETVVISGDRIAAVKRSSEMEPPAGVRVVDGRGRYLIPALWDMHVHAVFAERLDSMFPMFMANGVLGIRDVGTSMPLAQIGRLRKEIFNGARLGPRIVAAGPILDGRPLPARPNFAVITSPEEGRSMVRRLKAEGSDFIKVYSWLSRESFLAIADEANKQNMTFGGHVPFSVSVLEASDVGQRSMEHLYGIALACSTRETEIRTELVQGGTRVSFPVLDHLEIEEAGASYSVEKAASVFAHLAKNHTWVVPTFAADLPDVRSFDLRVTSDERLKYIPPGVQERWSKDTGLEASSSPWGKFFDQRLRMLSAMHRAGVPVLAGTDTAWYQPYTYAGFSLHDELAVFVQAGLTPLESLQTATINPARFLGLEKDLGTIEEGKIADLVLLDGDPLTDIHNTGRISTVFASGKEFDRRALVRMLKQAEAASKLAVVN
jgi:imidazolonepropionase-like amidohydrolase